MQEKINKLIQRYEDQHKELEFKAEKAHTDCDHYQQLGAMSQLEDVIADLKTLLDEQKKYDEQIRKICNEQRG